MLMPTNESFGIANHFSEDSSSSSSYYCYCLGASCWGEGRKMKKVAMDENLNAFMFWKSFDFIYFDRAKKNILHHYDSHHLMTITTTERLCTNTNTNNIYAADTYVNVMVPAKVIIFLPKPSSVLCSDVSVYVCGIEHHRACAKRVQKWCHSFCLVNNIII